MTVIAGYLLATGARYDTSTTHFFLVALFVAAAVLPTVRITRAAQRNELRFPALRAVAAVAVATIPWLLPETYSLPAGHTFGLMSLLRLALYGGITALAVKVAAARFDVRIATALLLCLAAWPFAVPGISNLEAGRSAAGLGAPRSLFYFTHLASYREGVYSYSSGAVSLGYFAPSASWNDDAVVVLRAYRAGNDPCTDSALACHDDGEGDRYFTDESGLVALRKFGDITVEIKSESSRIPLTSLLSALRSSKPAPAWYVVDHSS